MKDTNYNVRGGILEAYPDKVIIAEMQVSEEIGIEVLHLYVRKCLVH